eukprot:CAMPEP_0201934760 /NCGR_PEP_ID=MMETSP0903-20130614/34248_1 /ASSEMBLY_ACC=CAM_ASM_000552 /TAXON_ID=420261 /ORGANISM="Thalassiosira antarctica, Strain CCMP982" /LENGTH=433 /DNA_ID=CAMNT_0048475033 /DNA_START=28 /DNA_END=1326 /DNA_ORIENTATION=-
MTMSEECPINETQKKRSRPGKCARRRKRKARAILEAAAAPQSTQPAVDGQGGDNDNAATVAVTTAVPSDRGYTLEGVKVRRREERERRSHSILKHDGLPVAAQDVNPIDDALLDPNDEHQLQSQLGFIPGNAVCVAARLSKEFDAVFKSQSSNSNNDGQEKEATMENSLEIIKNELAQPSVVKLYPMVVRESYRGGKSDGRAFKGRRRGAMRVKGKGDDEGSAVGAVGSQDKGEPNTSERSKKERSWVVESSTNINQDTTPAHDTNPPHNGKNNQQEPPQQIIEPFPTLYWLTSPLLRTFISKIEISKDNGVVKMEERLRSSPSFLSQMERAHKSYGKHRWELLTPQDQTNIMQRGWKAALDESRGVAGIRLKNDRYDCVKCLHAHAAHYLAQVSELTAEEEEKQGGLEGENGKSVEVTQECGRDDLNLVGKW